MPWYLEVRTPDQAVAVYQLDIGKILHLGRDEGEIRVTQDKGISSLHLKLQIKENEVLWDDMKTTNGTIHRSRKKASGVLLPGDVLSIGNTSLRFDPRPGAVSPATSQNQRK